MERIPNTPLGFERFDGCWVITGLRHGDCWIPQSRGAKTIHQAVEQAEAWLAPEIDKDSNDSEGS